MHFVAADPRCHGEVVIDCGSDAAHYYREP